MEKCKRIRVVFKDDDILSETQKSGGLSRSWVLLKPHQHDTISDVASYLLHAFQLHQSCPHGLLLSISSFVLPPFESGSILKDDEIIRVQKRTDVLAIAGNNAANDIERTAEKQPVNSGFLLLANEEFEKEKGGYESDEPEAVEDDDEEDLKNPSGSNADKKNRKRKAAHRLQRSKEKKQRSNATGSASNTVLTDKEKIDDPIAGDCMENSRQPAKLIDKSTMSMKGTAEVQGNSKETDDTEIAPKEAKKAPSRSARRKSAKRRWLREMAKIQKQNATCESEGLRNWKEDQAKAGKKQVDGQVKGQQKWKKHKADADRGANGRPKGLLCWTPQDNWLVKGKKKIQNGDGHQQPTDKQGDSHQQPGQKVHDCENKTCNASEQLDQESGEENEFVPIVIRPGHIRFEPLGKEQAVQEDHVRQETFQWNGIISKEKGQQWGKESRPFTTQKDYKTSGQEYNEILDNEKEKQADEGNKEKQSDDRTDFDKLPPLLGTPEKGGLIAYRILELSTSWTPELSPYRVGKVSWYNAKSDRTMLVPVPEYPLISDKADENETAQLDSSLYKEDGSLVTKFSSLIDVRILNNGRLEPRNEATSCLSEGMVGDADASVNNIPSVVPTQDATGSNQGKETQPPTTENISESIWDHLSEALNAKKEQLSKENGWGSTPKKVQLPSVNGWGSTPISNKVLQHSQENSCAKKPSPRGNWGKKAQEAQGSKANSWGNQGSGSNSWSDKAP